MEVEGRQNWIEYSKPADLTNSTIKNFQKLFILYFYTEWNEQSLKFKESLEATSEFILEPLFVSINAENFKDLSESFKITTIPTVVFMDGNRHVLKKWESPSPNKIYDQIKEMLKFHGIHFEKTKTEMKEKVSKILNQHQMVIFIKGSPNAPECKFTRQLLEELEPFDLNYYYFDILRDEDIRSWNRFLSGKGTYPQIYFNQKLIGGLDDLRAFKASGEFEKMIPEMAKKDIPARRVTRILTSGDVVAVLKGEIDSDLCEKSKHLLEFLKSQPVKFNVFNGESDGTLLNEFLSRAGENASLPLLFVQGQNIASFENLADNYRFLNIVPLQSWKLEGKEKFEVMQKLFEVCLFVDDLIKESSSLHVIKALRDTQSNFAVVDISKETSMKSYLMNERMNYSPMQIYMNGELQENSRWDSWIT